MNRELQENRANKLACPRCGAPVSYAKQYFIDWDDANRQFRVNLAFYCPPCHHRFQEAFVKHLPLEISKRSACKCGAKLELIDYKIKRLGDDVEFDAVYKCKECGKRKRSITSKIKTGLAEIWNKTTKVQIGPKGVSYEKKAKS